MISLKKEIKSIRIENEEYILTIELKKIKTDKLFIPELNLWIFFLE
jgi:hypothetical protein